MLLKTNHFFLAICLSSIQIEFCPPPSSNMTLDIIEVARVVPATNSDSVHNAITIPLTFLDLPWLVFNPVKRILFYKLTDSTREHFHSIIVPNLKLSLSLVLRHFLPLSGRVIWNPDDPKPSIIVSPNDAVSVTIAETEADFSHLSGYGQRAVSELNTLVPDLQISDDSLSVLSLQITLFPDQGFSISVAALHAVSDGKTTSMFIKAWAHFSKQLLLGDTENEISLPENLTPSYDRSSLISKGLDSEMMEAVRSFKKEKTNMRSLSPLPGGELGDDVVLATVVLSRDDIEKLRERVKSESEQSDLHLSAFVIAYAYVWTCLVKARGGSGERSVSFAFVADFRERLVPQLPVTYFGNCMFLAGRYNHKAEEFANERGFVRMVEMLSDLVKGLSSRKIETVAKDYADGFDYLGVSSQFGTIAGSSRLRVYETDFGWGRPVKIEIVSIGGESISMGERRDESGGLEIGMCMDKTQMDIVISFFTQLKLW